MENRKKKLTIGLLGFGSMGRTHLWAVKNLPFFYGDLGFSAEVLGVCTTSPEKSQRVVSEFGIPRAAKSAEELISDPDIDIIDICTPNICHFDQLRQALAQGKHILCEKPLCINAEQAKEIALVAKEQKKVCGMVFNNRWLSPALRAKGLIDEGRIGRILHFHASYLHNSCIDPDRRVGWKQDKEICGGGVLFDLGSHVIDLMSHLCGRFECVSGQSQIAYQTHTAPNGEPWTTNADEAFYLHTVTKDGAHGTIEVSKLTNGASDDLSFEIYGEKGSLKFSLMAPDWLWFYDATAQGTPIGGTRGWTQIECVGRYPDMIFPSPKASTGWIYGHLNSMKNYLSHVSEGLPFAPSLEDGAYVQLVMDAAYRSDSRGGVLTEVDSCN